MQNELSFNGDLSVVTLQTLRPGGWYIGFQCPRCSQHFAIMDEPTGSGALRLSGPARFQAVCPNCEETRAYAVSDMVVFQAAQGGPTSTA